ncbi:hypothetical protein VNO77_22670 [Canavalia gladiata]|uniref:Uncharacterized protein n=1 Tax=Canavalia gladiata TaxID=3824 RepID=A0AAN9L3H8_CANGL
MEFIMVKILTDSKSEPQETASTTLARLSQGGLFGLGGGLVLGSLFLELGVLPQVASVASAFATCKDNCNNSAISNAQYLRLVTWFRWLP